ncbi:MAG TPA: tetratricopeptide repeat protein [archaeon]|nr:tetratricopeptide repeat protein [archaeon]
MMHLLLLVPSSFLLILLFLHSWHYRGRGVTLAFFISSFAFGVLRGNLIHLIITRYFGGETLPYLFLRPMVKIWHASVQECIGWVFALYLSWSTVEWVLSRQGHDKVPLFRLIGLSAFFMGTISYAVEAAAAGVKWWVWIFPIKNPFLADVPFAGIVAWISVVFDFLCPFLLIYHKAFRHWTRYLLFCLFPIHMLFHMKVTNISAWLPVNPAELWHWVFLCLLFWGIAAGGPEITTPFSPAVEREERKSILRFAVLATAAGFILVLASAHLFIIRNPEIAISLVPFIAGLLYFKPLYSTVFCAGVCLLFGVFTGAWSYTLVPLLVWAIFGLGSSRFSKIFSLKRRRIFALAILILSTAAAYYYYSGRYKRYEALSEIADKITAEKSTADLDSLLARLPGSPKAEDAYHYNKLGMQLLKRKNYPAAMLILQKSLACDSTYAYAYINLAWAYRQTRDYEAAIKAYEKGLALNPIDYDSYLLLGEIYQGLDRLKEAEALYRRGLEYDNTNTKIVLALESILYRQERLQEAVELLKSSLPGKGDTKKIESRLAADLFKMGRSEEAVSLYQNVISEDISHLYAAATSLALIYWRDRGMPKKALEYVILASAVNPTADIFALKGAICEELGLEEEARAAYLRAAELKNVVSDK